MPEARFYNELGNEIEITIAAEEPAAGIKGVNIRLQGPTSTSENIITLKEANELSRLLAEFLATLR